MRNDVALLNVEYFVVTSPTGCSCSFPSRELMPGQGRTALIWAACDRDKSVVEVLLEHGAAVNQADKDVS